jgi:adenylate cyclase
MRKHLHILFSLNAFTIWLTLNIAVLALFIAGVPFLDLMELKTYDLRFLSARDKKPSPEVVMAVIDEKSLDREGRWPWPRSKIAKLIDLLSQDGAKVLGFDIAFIEPDENNIIDFIDQLDMKLDIYQGDNTPLKKFIDEKKLEADNDLILAKAIKDSKAEVILGHFFYMTPDFLDYRLEPAEIQKRLSRIDNSKYPVASYEKPDMEADPFTHAYAPETNLETLTDAAGSSGYFNMVPDREDGVVRRLDLVFKCGDEIYAPMAVQTVWSFLDRPPLVVKVAGYGIEGIQMGERFIPTDEKGRMLINYMGPEKSLPHFSISDILERKFPKGTFTDKIVLVGATAIGVYDKRTTPVSSSGEYPGLEVHATVIDNILKGDFLHKPEWTRLYDALAILIIGLLVGLIIPRLNALKGISFASGLFILQIIITRTLFIRFGLWVNMVYPSLILVLMYTSLTVYRYLGEERERKRIKGAFSHYVSSTVVQEMLKSPEKLRLGGEERDLSVLFSDIRGFTSISEDLSPEELVHLLNEYLTVMTDIILKYDGTLDKYMGDAIMAIYGAPLKQPDHPFRACRSALEMMAGLKKLNEKWREEGEKPLDVGIGINTGNMVVGNMGSELRFDYTVMGDAVNLASRLEDANKTYKTNVLISETTYEQVKGEFVCMELDKVRVKGKTKPVRIYELLGDKRIFIGQMEVIETFHQGLRFYERQEWDKAIGLFRDVLSKDKTFRAAQMYIQRAMDLKVDSPPQDWDGVFTITRE